MKSWILVVAAGILACRPTPDSMTADRSHALHLELLAPPSARVGDPVHVTIRLSNRGREPLDVHLQGRDITFDVVVRDEAGVVVWRRLEGAVTQGILRLETLAPGGSLDLSAVWTPAGPGNYTIEGVLPTDAPQPLRTRAAPLTVT